MDYYSILQVPKTASYKQIRQNYRRLAAQYHPDKNPNKHTSNKFIKINTAYNTLNDPYKRGRYDVMLEQKKYSTIDQLFSININNAFDIFNNFFKNEPSFLNTNELFDDLTKNGRSNYFKSYSSSNTFFRNKDGIIKREQRVKVNDNGKKNEYSKKYWIDKYGKKHDVMVKGDPKISYSNRLLNKPSTINFKSSTKSYPNVLNRRIRDPKRQKKFRLVR